MAIGITVVKDSLETLFTEVTLTGLTAGTRYDVHRLQQRYLGKNDTGARVYQRELPDRRALWSAVAHRVGWAAPSTTATFRDYECPMRPMSYFVVASSAVGPHEYTSWATPYPISRGVLDSQVIHWNQDLREAGSLEENHVMIRSTADLADYTTCCVAEMDGPKYTARGTEHSVLGSQYPVYVADTREARRGTITLLTRTLGSYNAVRRIVFPSSGKIHPVIFNSDGDAAMLLDDMWVIPLDVTVEQVTLTNPDLRYLHVDYVEIDPSAPIYQRAGDNDALVNKPVAQFTISKTKPKVNEWVTLTDTSTGQGDTWDWTIERGNETDNKVGKFYTKGPHKVRWGARGKKTVKLRFGGSAGGYHTRSKVITVG